MSAGYESYGEIDRLPRAGTLARIRHSLHNPQLIGHDGARRRYLKLQWWIVLWRLLILIQIPVVAAIRPQRFTNPLWYEFMLMAVAIAYTALFYWLATRTAASETRYLHLIDLAACAALMVAGYDEKLIFIFLFFSFSSLLAWPTTRLGEAFLSSLFLSFAYMGARWMIGDVPWTIYSDPNRMGAVALFFFWGIGFVGFSAVMERASALELDSRLEEQRRDYRRRLHDDLGNTLCGLHFKIQGLKRSGREDLRGALEFLSQGYDRANAVLMRILSGIDRGEAGDLEESLRALCAEIGEMSGQDVELSFTAGKTGLSPELTREVTAIVRESLTNAVKHADAAHRRVEIGSKRGQLLVLVTDDGRGFGEEELAARQADGSRGITGMHERAGLMNAVLKVGSAQGEGTRVELRLDTRGQTGLLARALDKNPQNAGGGVYPYLIRLRMFMYAWTMFEILVQPAGEHLSLPLAAVIGGLTLDALGWFFFRNALYRAVSRHNWLLLIENLFFGLLTYIALAGSIPFFFSLYVGVVVIVNGLFFGSLGNLLATAVLNASLLAAFTLAPADMVGYTASDRYEPALQHVIIFFILAVSSGLAGEFVLGLENLQLEAVGRALLRQRESLTADTHRQLHDLVRGLGDEIQSARRSLQSAPETLEEGLFTQIETNSTDLKIRLRAIIASLE